MTDKQRVRDFWNQAPCGEIYAQGDQLPDRLEAQARARYRLEPYLPEFARFAEGCGRDVLELGVGMGADHLEWARSRPRSLTGIDLTPKAVAYTKERLRFVGLASRLLVADVERLPLPGQAFDLVYSWGVIHHSPDTPAAALEIRRVLRPGGQARVMIYHRHSLVGYMLWLRYGLLAGRPRLGLREAYARHLESPGTKAYSPEEARKLFAGFSEVRVRTLLSPGDLLQGAVGERHRSFLLTAAKALYPRWAVRRLLTQHGLYLLIEATK
ncbi:MAG TPA: class I SAM-dependent methyltransferase [Vicinamibacteria bacterium]|nr:class I SAM-dependent methyltransferase [Vicinamibacteria bacterium]